MQTIHNFLIFIKAAIASGLFLILILLLHNLVEKYSKGYTHFQTTVEEPKYLGLNNLLHWWQITVKTQDINRVFFSFRWCLNGIHFLEGITLLRQHIYPNEKRKRSKYTYQSLNSALPSRKGSIKAPTKCKTFVYLLTETYHQWSKLIAL